jgi:hypothetical protein
MAQPVRRNPDPLTLAPSDAGAGAGPATPYPGLWARGSFAGIDRNDIVSFTGFGPTSANLNRNQSVGDFEGGFDFGKRDLLSAGDALIFGVLGGFVVSELNYDQLPEKFEFKGGEVGAWRLSQWWAVRRHPVQGRPADPHLR